MTKAEEALKEFGLSEKEVQVYLACLELGSATANDIAVKAKINRSTTYDILKLFLEKGIASKVISSKTTNFEVSSPSRLLSIIEEKKTKLLSSMEELKQIQERVIKKPILELYEGEYGIKTILEDIITTKKQTDVISTSKIFQTLTYDFPKYIAKRAEAKIYSRVIQEDSPYTKQLKKKDKQELRETRSIKNFEVNSAIFIYGDKVAILKLAKNEFIGVLITDKTLADDKRQIFELLWKTAEK